MRTICEWVDVGRGLLEYLAGETELGFELEVVDTPEGVRADLRACPVGPRRCERMGSSGSGGAGGTADARRGRASN